MVKNYIKVGIYFEGEVFSAIGFSGSVAL